MINNRNNLVTIIMAAYNAEKTIEQAINSVLTQTYTNWELIVINDCSQDMTYHILTAIAEHDSRIKIINNKMNEGVSISRKKGLIEANGDWIAVLDSDDMWLPDKLEKQLNLASEHGAELVFTGSSFIDNEGNHIDWELHVPNQIVYKDLLKQNLVSNSSVLVKKDLYQRYYVIGDDMHEDFAVWLGITKAGKTAYGIDEPLLIYRIAKGSKSGNKFKAARMNWNTYRYVGLNVIQTMYYMCWYTMRGLKKYKHLK